MIDSEQPVRPWLTSSGESQLSIDDVHVWRVNVKSLAGRVHQWTSLLSHTERSRAKAFIHKSDRERFIVTHGALRILLGSYLNVAPADIKFSKVARKKPCLEGVYADSGLQFNLSHAHEQALLAFTYHKQVGIDIEHIRHLPDLEQIAAKTFSHLENQELKGLQPQRRLVAFYRCWTRKEAFVKALGEGLYYPLNRFSVSISSTPSNCLLEIEGNLTETSRWAILGLEAPPGYAAALAVESHDRQPVFWEYRLED